MNKFTMIEALGGLDEDLLQEHFRAKEALKMKKRAVPATARSPILANTRDGQSKTARSDFEISRDMKMARKNKRRWIKWVAAAACFCLILVCVPTIIHILNPSQMVDSYRRGIEYKVNSIAELPAEYGGKLLVQNLELTENAQIELYYNEGGSAENAGDWFSLIISDTIHNEAETEIIGGNEVPKIDKRLLVHCFFDGRSVEKQMVDMVFTEDATETATINGVEVQIARHGISLDFEYWYYAVFEYDGVVYDIRTKANQQEYIYDILEQLLFEK